MEGRIRAMARILLVESDSKLQLLLRLLLEEQGYEVIATCDGYSAVELYTEKPANLVICNLLNPSQNGLQTLEAIKSINEFILGVVISGSDLIDDLEYREAALKVGIQATFTKPFDIRDFTKCINSLLNEILSKTKIDIDNYLLVEAS